MSAKHRESSKDCRNSLLKTHILPHFENKIIAEVSPSDIGDFLKQLRGKVSSATQLQVFKTLQLMFEIARQYDYVEQSPVRPLVHKPDHQRLEKPTLTAEQIKSVLLRMPQTERLYVMLLAVTGIRMGEGLALRWLDFNESTRELTITHTIYKRKLREPKTKTSKGKLRLHPMIVRLLIEHRAQSNFRDETDFIFCRLDGSPMAQEVVRMHMHKAMDDSEINRLPYQHGFHIFRHSAGTMLYDLLGDMERVQTALRHADRNMTAQYVHSQQAIEGAELLTEAILGNAEPFFALDVTKNPQRVH